MFDRAGRLLYVGISFNAGERATQHAETKPWWPQVDHIRIEHLECSREDALRRERWAIYEEMPLHNIQHNHARNPLSARGAIAKPYQIPESLRKMSEWHDLKKATLVFVGALTAQRDANRLYEEDRRWVPGGASILDIDNMDALGLIEAMALACRYSEPCRSCGDLVVPDYVMLQRGGTYVSTDDTRCTSQPIRYASVAGYCPACDALTDHKYIDLKEAA
jgi:hypothetical protein